MRAIQTAILLLCALACSARAQDAKPDLSTPGSTIRGFMAAVDFAKFPDVAAYVYGAKADEKLKKFFEMRRPGAPQKLTEVTNLKAEITGHRAVAEYDLMQKVGPSERPLHQKTHLRQDGGRWRIIPAPAVPDFSKTGPENHDDLIEIVAAIIVKPASAGPVQMASNQTKCLSNLKVLALAASMLAADNDGRIAMNGVDWVKKILPYLHNREVLRCPDSPAAERYSYNAKLADLRLEKVAHPDQVVLFYEGKGGKLTFRHNGRAAVAFLDGHVRLVGPADAAGLVWNPAK